MVGSMAKKEARASFYTIPPNCGIPAGTEAVSLNFTVTETVSHPFGQLKIWPADQAEPNVSTLNRNTVNVTESNAAIVALSSIGQIAVKTGNAGAHVIIDTNGYFTDEYNPGVRLFAQITGAGGSSREKSLDPIARLWDRRKYLNHEPGIVLRRGSRQSTMGRVAWESAFGDPRPVAGGASWAKRRRASASSGESQRTATTGQECWGERDSSVRLAATLRQAFVVKG
jgi:hypothetical protein